MRGVDPDEDEVDVGAEGEGVADISTSRVREGGEERRGGGARIFSLYTKWLFIAGCCITSLSVSY